MATIGSGWALRPRTAYHAVSAFEFATVSSCDQLVVGPTHPLGTLDLLMTDVNDLVPVAVEALVQNSDHPSLSAVISMAQPVPNVF